MRQGNLIKAAIGFGAFVTFSICQAAAPFTALTAPDAPSRLILSHTLSTLAQGAPAGVDSSPTIHKNFPQIIEQNFARLDNDDATTLIDNLSDRELSDLGALYTTANADTGHLPQLLSVLALRLDGVRLGRISKYFGYAPVYEAVLHFAPQKVQDFSQNTSSSYASPIVGIHTMAGLGQWMNYTPQEIYLDLRTAPVGALGVTGALYESAAALATGTGIAYGVGYTAGSAAASLIQTYSPSLWDAIGGTVAGAVQNIQNAASLASEGKYEQSMGTLFGLTPTVSKDQSSFGGDYGVSNPWENYVGGGTCVDHYCQYPH
jgi:hypothetical protein